MKTNTRRLPSDFPLAVRLMYSHLVFICFRYGNKVSEAKQRRLQVYHFVISYYYSYCGTLKIGCRSKIYFYSHNGKLHLRWDDFRHNHEVRPDLVHFPPKRWRTKREKKERESLSVLLTASLTEANSCVIPLSRDIHELNFQFWNNHAVMILNEPGFSEEIEEDDSLLENRELPQFRFHQNSFDNGMFLLS